MQEHIERIDVGGHRLRCAVSGDVPGSDGPPFLCLHGLVDRLEIWDRVAAALASRRGLVRVDQRGHGESETPPGPYTRDALASDAVRVLDALGIDRALLVGHSMGGIVSMAAALLHPDRVAGLVLIGTASRCNERTADWYETIARAGEQEGLAGLRRVIYGADSGRRITGDPLGIAHVTRMLQSLFHDPLTPRLAELVCDVLLLVGEKDPMGARASERIEEGLPSGRATLQVFPGRGHWLHVEAPDELVRALDAWRATEGEGLGGKQ